MVAWTLVAFALGAPGAGAQLPPPPVPPENPFSEAKRILGKALFWEEQLSSDNRLACGTCHLPSSAGADPAVLMHPGADQTSGTADDAAGSAGVARADDHNRHLPDPWFGFGPQATRRSAQAILGTQYAPEMFWDGRAPSTFVDPLDGSVAVAAGGALESQALAPILSAVEMGHPGRDWPEVTAKLGAARPLALAVNLPADLRAALHVHRDYPALFAAAFGDPGITPRRIAFAIATYERTLVPDQTPWDAYVAGDTTALTPTQTQGWNAYQGSLCLFCHTPPFFTDSSFRNIGLRPWQEDPGRMEVTGDSADRGRFKVPTLRNVGLRETYMHHGRLTSLAEVLDFYLQQNGQVHFTDNQDSLVAFLNLAPENVSPLVEFLTHGLTDARAAAGAPPFDRPVLGSERARLLISLEGGGASGAGGRTPRPLVSSPLVTANPDFRIGVADAAGGAAFLAIGTGAGRPEDLPFAIDPRTVFALVKVPLNAAPTGGGYGTYQTGVPPLPDLLGREVRFQWLVPDGSAPDGLAASAAVRYRVL